MVRHTNLKFLFFLNHYDLIDKYNYSNYYLIPYYSKISLKVFLKGFFNKKLFKKYLENFLLLYFFCFNASQVNLKLSKFKNRRLRIYKVKMFINYSIMKKKIFLSIYNFFFLFNRFIRPFFFSQQNFIFSKFSGKLCFFNIKIITFLPRAFLLDSIEQKALQFLKTSKIFLTLTLKNILTITKYNFFNSRFEINKNFLKNFLVLWCLV